MESNQNDLLRETYRLAQENNRMLHSMRRNAFWGGLFKFLLWAGLIAAPLWFYSTYLAPVVHDLQKTINEVQGVSSQAQGQFNGFTDTLKQLEAKLKAATAVQP
jgi:hypothetical protein